MKNFKLEINLSEEKSIRHLSDALRSVAYRLLNNPECATHGEIFIGREKARVGSWTLEETTERITMRPRARLTTLPRK